MFGQEIAKIGKGLTAKGVNGAKNGIQTLPGDLQGIKGRPRARKISAIAAKLKPNDVTDTLQVGNKIKSTKLPHLVDKIASSGKVKALEGVNKTVQTSKAGDSVIFSKAQLALKPQK